MIQNNSIGDMAAGTWRPQKSANDLALALWQSHRIGLAWVQGPPAAKIGTGFGSGTIPVPLQGWQSGGGLFGSPIIIGRMATR
jgi:hypothetical protein